MKAKIFTFMPYYKAGEDFGGHLTHCGDDVQKAILSWADQMEAGAAAARRIASLIKGTDIGVQCGTTDIVFENLNEKTEALLETEGAIGVGEIEIDDDEVGQEG